MYCPYCGTPLQGNPRFCPTCGTALRPTDTPPAGAPPKNPPDNSGRGGKKKVPVALIGAIAVVAVVAVAACVMVFGDIWTSDGGSDSDTDAAVTSTDATEADDTAADDTESSTPTSATTYYTEADGEEALYSIKTYYADGTIASIWTDESAVSSEDETSELRKTYDEGGNLLTSAYTYEGSSSDSVFTETIIYSYTYDSAGRPVLVTETYEVDDEGAEVICSFTVSYEGDALSSTEYADDSESAYVADFTADSAGNIVQADLSYVSDG